MTLRVVKGTKRTKPTSQLQQVISFSRRCATAWDSGAHDLALELMHERDTLCETLSSADRKAYLTWARAQFTDEEWAEFMSAFATIVGVACEMTPPRFKTLAGISREDET